MVRRGLVVLLLSWGVLVAVAGCAPAPTAPVPGSDETRTVGTGASSGVEPFMPDTNSAEVPVSVQFGGVATLGAYTVFVPPASFDRDGSMRLDAESDGSLRVRLNPSNLRMLAPPTLVVDLATVPDELFGDWALYEWVDSKSAWVRLESSMSDPSGRRISANIPGEGRYKAMTWTVAEPEADTVVANMAVTSLRQSIVKCGKTKLVVPAGALHADGTVSMRWQRRDNVVELEVHPEELNGFDVPVMLTLDTSALSPEERAAARVGWWNPERARWEQVPGAVCDVERGTVTAPLRHFSTYTVVFEGKAGWGSIPGGPRMIID